MYSGNLGLYYDLENLIAITTAFRHCKDLLFVFIGDGAVKKRMIDYVQKNGMEEQVRFLPFLPKEELKHSLNAADLHLVVNQKGIKGVSVPSKIYGVMAAGKPILGVLEQGSEAERLIHESGCGVVVEPQDYEAVKRRLGELYRTDRDRLRLLGLQGRSYLEKHLRRDISLEKYRNLLLSLQK
jgi:glycosyltransferase involved in cell wall biosynthesis